MLHNNKPVSLYSKQHPSKLPIFLTGLSSNSKKMRPPFFILTSGILIICILFLFWDKRPVLAVPRDQVQLFEKALAKNKGISGFQEFRLTTWEGSTPTDKIIKKSDFIVTRINPDLRRQADTGLIQPLLITPAQSSIFPVHLLRFIPFDTRLKSGDAIGIPLSFDPFVAIWRNDKIGGIDAVPPAHWEELFDNKQNPRIKYMLGLAGIDRKNKLEWLGFFATFQLKETSQMELAATWDEAVQNLEAVGNKQLYQQGSFSYGLADTLLLLTKGDCSAVFAPISSYYALDIPIRGQLKVSTLPISTKATQVSTIADVTVIVRSSGIKFYNYQTCLKSLLAQNFQETIASATLTLPCNLSGQFRDEAAFLARERARSSAYWMILGDSVIGETKTEELLNKVDIALRAASMIKR